MLEIPDLTVLFTAFVNALLYPLNSFFSMIWGWISLILNAVLGLYHSIILFFNSITSFITSISSIMFPGTWGTLILIGLSIVFLLRLYYFLKDVEIMGFKI